MHSAMLRSLVAGAVPEDVVVHSFKDMHTWGLDYICLHRSDALTVKLYVFEGDVSKAAEVVHPHDHRYDFQTIVLAGELVDIEYHETLDPDAPVYQRFAWRTPMNGGGGFEWAGEARVDPICQRHRHDRQLSADVPVYHSAEDIHTIRVVGDRTALLLLQGRDRPGLDFTTTYLRDKEPPLLDGLYSRFTVDQINARLDQLGLGRLGSALR